MTTVDRPQYSVIGTRPIRHDGVDKVTGRAIYSNDVDIRGHLTGKVLRSPHAHARILSIDTSKAEALPGVRAVVTGADMPYVSPKLHEQAETSMVNLGMLSRNTLAQGKALFAGHAVAAVAADNARIADEALRLIDVRYEVLYSGHGRRRSDEARRAYPHAGPEDQHGFDVPWRRLSP